MQSASKGSPKWRKASIPYTGWFRHKSPPFVDTKTAFLAAATRGKGLSKHPEVGKFGSCELPVTFQSSGCFRDMATTTNQAEQLTPLNATICRSGGDTEARHRGGPPEPTQQDGMKSPLLMLRCCVVLRLRLKTGIQHTLLYVCACISHQRDAPTAQNVSSWPCLQNRPEASVLSG